MKQFPHDILIKKISIPLTFFALLLFSGCNTIEENGGTSMKPLTHSENMMVVGPSKEFTLEDHIQTANELLAAVNDSYQKMTALTAESDASPEAVKAGEQITAQYSARIAELNDADFSTWSADDLSDLTTELSNIISDIRAVRDLFLP